MKISKAILSFMAVFLGFGCSAAWPGPLPGPKPGGGGAAAPTATETVLTSAGSALSATTSGKVIRVWFEGLSNANSNAFFLTFNGETAQTGYAQYQTQNTGGSVILSNPGAGNSQISHTTIAINNAAHVSCELDITRTYDSSTGNTYIRAQYKFFHFGFYLGSGGIHKQFTGDVPLSAIAIRSVQASGLKAGSFLVVQKIL